MTVGQFGALFYNIENNLADLANKKKDRKKMGERVRRSMVAQCWLLRHLFVPFDELAKALFATTLFKSIKQEYPFHKSIIYEIAQDFMLRPNWSNCSGNFFDSPYQPIV